MPRKRTGYDAACYYDGKLLGRCTKADSDAYIVQHCGNTAVTIPPFVFVVDGCNFRFSHFVFVCAPHPL